MKETLANTEVPMKNAQSRETGSIGYTRRNPNNQVRTSASKVSRIVIISMYAHLSFLLARDLGNFNKTRFALNS